VKPVLQALVLAEKIYEAANGQKIIAGTFNGIHFAPKPQVEQPEGENGPRKVIAGADPGAPWVYISLTDVVSNTKLDLQFVSLQRNKVLFETKITIPTADRLETIELIMPLPHLRVPEAGMYAFEVVCDGEIVGSHRLRATLDAIEEEGD
jgi:hypothetical protein